MRGLPAQKAAEYDLGSPIHHAGPRCPPMLLIQGAHHFGVEVSQSRQLHAACAAPERHRSTSSCPTPSTLSTCSLRNGRQRITRPPMTRRESSQSWHPRLGTAQSVRVGFWAGPQRAHSSDGTECVLATDDPSHWVIEPGQLSEADRYRICRALEEGTCCGKINHPVDCGSPLDPASLGGWRNG